VAKSGLGLGGRFLNRQGREVRQGRVVFLNSSLFLLGVLGGSKTLSWQVFSACLHGVET
jgi:hypothetical protein